MAITAPLPTRWAQPHLPDLSNLRPKVQDEVPSPPTGVRPACDLPESSHPPGCPGGREGHASTCSTPSEGASATDGDDQGRRLSAWLVLPGWSTS